MKWIARGSLVWAGAATACAWWMAGRPGQPRHDAIIMSHATHVADNGLGCETCHGNAGEAPTLEAMPSLQEAVCLDCHEREDNCDQCHQDITAALPSRQNASGGIDLTFSHAAHTPRVEGKCDRCHEGIEDAATLPIARTPMFGCMQCHEMAVAYAQGRCLTCHPQMRRAPPAATAELLHGGDWLEKHGGMARGRSDVCLHCHGQATCSECHSRVAAGTGARLYPERLGASTMHRGDWLAQHATEARLEPDGCARCHETSYCQRCHDEQGIRAGADPTHQPHPAGYAVRGGGSVFHGDEARLRIWTCAGCHDRGAASDCVRCHQSGGLGGNPHPAGWAGRYDLADAGERAMCRACHQGG